MKRLIAGLCLLALLAGCAPAPETTIPTEPDVLQTIPSPETTVPESTIPPETTVPPDPAELLLESMTLEEKVGQLFIVAPEALDGANRPVTSVTEELTQNLERYRVGGIILFADNITSPEQVKSFLSTLQETSRIPLFLSVDEEGGLVARLANHDAFDLPRYRSAAAVGSSGDSHDALEMGYTIGGYLREYGFNMDFAPVADVNTNPNNPVIGNRAFSSDPEIAAQMAEAMAAGFRQQGIVAVFKHFPGHGDTAEDSHAGLAVSNKTREEMEQCEWIPFRQAGMFDCVMVGHVATPGITGDLTPATMSHQLVTGILKDTLGFSGLVITDSLQMGAITENHTPGEAAMNALMAGCHILLMPENLPEAFAAVLSATESGEYPEELLDEIVLRILRFKMDAGILIFE